VVAALEAYDLAEVRGELAVRRVRDVGARHDPLSEFGRHALAGRRGVRERVEPAIVGPRGRLVGGGVHLANGGHVAGGTPVLVRLAQAGERFRHRVHAAGDVLPGLGAVARHQVEDGSQAAGRCGDGTDGVQPVAGVVRCERGLEPFGDERLRQPVVVVGLRQLREGGQPLTGVVGSRCEALRRQVGEQMVEAGHTTAGGRDGVER
jgi:hypothetical protein